MPDAITGMVNGEVFDALGPLGLALALGLLVGVQRQHSGHETAGVRTFSLVTLLGAACSLAIPVGSGWLVAAGLLAVAALGVASHLRAEQAGDAAPGLTTEIAMLVMYTVGAMTPYAPAVVPVAVGVGTALLLHAKETLHKFSERLTEPEVRSILTFALISLVVLPLLPTEKFGPYDVWSVRNIWLMVVLVSGISLAGYAAHKLFDGHSGVLVAGVIGGLVSSTATTMSFARRAKEGAPVLVSAFVISAASCVVFVRVLVEIGATSRELLKHAAAPLGILMGVAVAVAGFVWMRVRKEPAETPDPKNPVELKPAMIFAALYAVVLLAVAWSREAMGEGGLLAVAAVSGLTDMDAITLSTARLVESGGVEASAAWKPIVVASMSNQMFKLGIIGVIAGRKLFVPMAALTGINVAAGAALLLVW
jgi:uncharacterized membrane protein (DUF4010 family)